MSKEKQSYQEWKKTNEYQDMTVSTILECPPGMKISQVGEMCIPTDTD